VSVRPDFSVGCAENGDFVVRELSCHAYDHAATLRDALNVHLDGLRERTRALHAILATSLPEEAEHLLLDATRMRIDEVTLRPPASRDSCDAFVNTSFRGGPSP
jgi:hypothetical protein